MAGLRGDGRLPPRPRRSRSRAPDRSVALPGARLSGCPGERGVAPGRSVASRRHSGGVVGGASGGRPARRLRVGTGSRDDGGRRRRARATAGRRGVAGARHAPGPSGALRGRAYDPAREGRVHRARRTAGAAPRRSAGAVPGVRGGAFDRPRRRGRRGEGGGARRDAGGEHSRSPLARLAHERAHPARGGALPLRVRRRRGLRDSGAGRCPRRGRGIGACRPECLLLRACGRSGLTRPGVGGWAGVIRRGEDRWFLGHRGRVRPVGRARNREPGRRLLPAGWTGHIDRDGRRPPPLLRAPRPHRHLARVRRRGRGAARVRRGVRGQPSAGRSVAASRAPRGTGRGAGSCRPRGPGRRSARAPGPGPGAAGHPRAGDRPPCAGRSPPAEHPRRSAGATGPGR